MAAGLGAGGACGVGTHRGAGGAGNRGAGGAGGGRAMLQRLLIVFPQLHLQGVVLLAPELDTPDPVAAGSSLAMAALATLSLALGAVALLSEGATLALHTTAGPWRGQEKPSQRMCLDNSISVNQEIVNSFTFISWFFPPTVHKVFSNNNFTFIDRIFFIFY